jgi:hypothetical protein
MLRFVAVPLTACSTYLCTYTHPISITLFQHIPAYDTHTGPGNDNLGLFLRHQALLFSVHFLFVGCLPLDRTFRSTYIIILQEKNANIIVADVSLVATPLHTTV